MKRFYKSLLFLIGFLPLASQAQVVVNLSNDVEALVVNGEELPLSVTAKTRFTLPNGLNQMLVRVSKLVQSTGSDFEKFKSDPLVVTFNASDTELTIEPTRKFFSEREIGDFKKDPSFKLVKTDGTNIEANQSLLEKGPGLLRNYEKEISTFNKKYGIEFEQIAEELPLATAVLPIPSNGSEVNIKSAAQQLKSDSVKPEQVETITKTTEVSPSNSMILMQADFLRMDSEQQQAFLQWAVKNLRP